MNITTSQIKEAFKRYHEQVELCNDNFAEINSIDSEEYAEVVTHYFLALVDQVIKDGVA